MLDVPACGTVFRHRSCFVIGGVLFLAATALVAQGAAGDASLTKARKALEQKDFAGAVREYQDFVAKFPKHNEISVALFELGTVHRSLRQFDLAAKQFAAAAEGFAARGKEAADIEWTACARCAEAEMLLRLGRNRDAQAAMALLLRTPAFEKSSYRGQALYYHGLASFSLNDRLAAVRSLSQLTPFTDSVFGSHAHYLLARIHHLEDERAEALVEYEAVLAAHEAARKMAVETLAQLDKREIGPGEKTRLEALANGPAAEHVARAAFYRSVLTYEAGRFADAKTQLSELLVQQPAFSLKAEAQLLHGLCAFRADEFTEAIEVLSPLVEKESPVSVIARFWLGQALAGSADPAESETFQPAMERAVHNLREAAKKFRPVANSDPATALQAKTRRGEILLELAETHAKAGQFKDAAELLGQLLDERLLPRREEEILQRRVSALNLAGIYSESERAGSAFLQAFPKSVLLPEVLFRRGENAYFMAQTTGRDAEEAARLYQLVIDRFPEAPQLSHARYGLALIHFRKGDYEKATAALEAIPAAERIGELTLAPYLQADCLIRLTPIQADDAIAAGRAQEQLGQAVELLGGMIKDFPEHPLAADALLRMGHCQQRLADLLSKTEERNALFAASRASFERVLTDYPLNQRGPHAAYERARAIARAGGEGSAELAISRFRSFAAEPMRKQPMAPLALLNLATLLRGQDAKQGEVVQVLTRCRQQYEKTLLRDPDRAGWVPLLQYHHGVALKEAGRFAEARGIFEMLRKTYPANPLAAEASLRWGQALVDEGWQTIEKADKTLNTAELPPSQKEAATKARADGWKLLRSAASHYEAEVLRLKEKQPAAEIRAWNLYELAWLTRAFADEEIDIERDKLQEALHEKLKKEAAKNTPAGQDTPDVPQPHIPLSQIPIQPAEKKTLELFRVILAQYPDLFLAGDVRLELAEILAARDDLAAAISLLNEALDKEPPAELTLKVRLRLGACLLAQGNVKGAMGQFEIVARHPEGALAGQGHLRSGECLLQLGDALGAVKRLSIFRDNEKFQGLGAVSDVALLRMGQALLLMKQPAEAREAFRLMIDRFGDSPSRYEARYWIGVSYRSQNRGDDAANAFAEAAADNNGTEAAARALFQVSVAQIDQKRYAEASQTLQSMVERNPPADLAALALWEAAWVQGQLKQSAEATRLLKRLQQDYPKSAAAVEAGKLKSLPLAAPHLRPGVLANLSVPDGKATLPLEPFGRQQDNRASLDDPTEDASRALILARSLPPRESAAPWIRLALPDPFENRDPVPLRGAAFEESPVNAALLRVPTR